MKKILSVFFTLVLITACASDDKAVPSKFAEPRFNEDGPVELKVNKVKVVSEFVPSYTRPNVEHLFPVSIEKTATTWAHDRLKAIDFSSDKQATFIIKDASITEEIVKSDKVFEKDSLRYRAKLSVVLKINDPYKFSNAETSLEAWRELTIPVDTTIEDKEIYWKGMVDKLFEEFNARMQVNINKYLNMYVADSQYVYEMN
jgi:hypothetical protein